MLSVMSTCQVHATPPHRHTKCSFNMFGKCVWHCSAQTTTKQEYDVKCSADGGNNKEKGPDWREEKASKGFTQPLAQPSNILSDRDTAVQR